jgi:uncharacterized protein
MATSFAYYLNATSSIIVHHPNMTGTFMNRLSQEHSPYLLQHANQPVNWFPWGDEVFQAAVREDKPVFFSSGYASCHWCHVMAHESFEDTGIAALLNEHFICVKVDREELPAVDSFYMTACHLMTGGGGWPLTIIMTPEKVPFFAATYLPNKSFMGHTGLCDLLPRIIEIWKNHRDDILSSAGRISNAIIALSVIKPGGEADPDLPGLAFQDLSNRYDAVHGGFDSAPKFPSPHNLLFLLRYWKRTGTYFALEMVEDTLDAIRNGGIHDHLGGGFHRYTTDEQWRIPHFEKMLVDQTMLSFAFTEAFHATGAERFGTTARETLEYILRTLSSREGVFYTSEDADTSDGEGMFFLWTKREIEEILSPDDASLAIRVYGITEDGNIREEAAHRKPGRNVLYLAESLDHTAASLRTDPRELAARLAHIRTTLLASREKRSHPLLDDKILTDWNGLAIAALAYAARIFDDNEYRDAALRAAGWLLATMRASDGELLHRWHGSHAGIAGTLDDYAFLVWGLIELYETTFDPTWLAEACALTREMNNRFGDTEHGGFYSTPTTDTSLPIRRKELYDAAYPSGNAIAILNLVRLSRLTGNNSYECEAQRAVDLFAPHLSRSVSAHTMLMTALELMKHETSEVVIAGDPDANDTQTLIRTINRTYLPYTTVLVRPSNSIISAIDRLAPFASSCASIEGRATAYVCRDHICGLPVTGVGKLLTLLTTSE